MATSFIEELNERVCQLEGGACTKSQCELIKKRLSFIEGHLYAFKEMLTLNEAAHYLDIMPSYLYKLTYTKRIPYYKPRGKFVYFRKVDLDKWLQRNKIETESAIGEENDSLVIQTHNNNSDGYSTKKD